MALVVVFFLAFNDLIATNHLVLSCTCKKKILLLFSKQNPISAFLEKLTKPATYKLPTFLATNQLPTSKAPQLGRPTGWRVVSLGAGAWWGWTKDFGRH